MNRKTATLILCLLYSGILLASETEKSHIKKPIIAPGKVYEACFSLNQGDSIDYSFKSDVGLRFNIHFHENKTVVYSIPVSLQKSAVATFLAEGNQRYCLMWKNPGKDAVEMQLRYQVNNNETI